MKKEQILSTLSQLILVRETVFNEIVNLSSSADLRAIDPSHEIGDPNHLSLHHFEEIKDKTVYSLIQLCKEVEQTFFNIMDNNHISDEEIPH